MKKLVFALSVLLLLEAVSCKKNAQGPSTGGSWTFYTTTYNAIRCSQQDTNGFFYAIAESPVQVNTQTASSLIFMFKGNSAPLAGTYTVVPALFPNDNEVSITGIFFPYGFQYQGTGIDAQSVTVSASNNLITLKSSGINMYNTLSPFDTSSVTFNVTF